MIYYGYRAASSDEYPMENVNLANLEGVVMYLHHEVIWGDGNTRKFNIDRINRYRIAMKSTRAAFNAPGGPGWPQDVRPQFARFAAFDYGQIGWNNPSTLPSVGCDSAGIRKWGVYNKQAYGENVTYFSLPGKCYSRPIDSDLHEKMPMTHGDYRAIDRTCVSRLTDRAARADMIACLKGNDRRQMSYSNQNASLVFGRSLGNLGYKKPDFEKDVRCNGGDTDPLYILCKDSDCARQEPGGSCGNPPRGDDSCTYSIAPIGHIMLDDLEVSHRLSRSHPHQWLPPPTIDASPHTLTAPARLLDLCRESLHPTTSPAVPAFGTASSTRSERRSASYVLHSSSYKNILM